MKKLFTICFISISFLGKSTIHFIGVADFQYNPSTVNAVIGDTIKWNLVSGHHTTTSTAIPSCASAWSSPINAFIPTYSMVVACAGTYNYHSTVDASMTGTIVVSGATSVSSIDNDFSFSVYPNPFTSSITIFSEMRNVFLKIMDVSGNIVQNIDTISQFPFTVERGNLASGIYFLELYSEGKRERIKLLIN